MKKVYVLSENLKANPERIALAQVATLDKSKPFVGFKGSHGLFGSHEWWQSIEEGRIPHIFISGRIVRAYCAGQDPTDINNTVNLVDEDGKAHSVGIFVNDGSELALFRVGSWLEVVYALCELKRQPSRDGGVNYSRVTLEMAVSLDTV